LSQLYEEMLINDLPEDDTLFTLHSSLERVSFSCSHSLRRLFTVCEGNTDSVSSPVGAKLPRLSVPTFDGDILSWGSFWEQYCISVHNRTGLSDAEKLAYLRTALGESSAKHAVEGLCRSSDSYSEAIECLKARYDKPRLVHQAHVKHIVDAPPLKEGSGKELRKLHDRIQQHLRALRSMGYEPSSAFITSMLELKLDTATMFEWQRHSQSHSDVPHYQELLEFIDHRAQAAEISQPHSFKKSSTVVMSYQRKTPNKEVASFPSSENVKQLYPL
jgi:hypothetical protein